MQLFLNYSQNIFTCIPQKHPRNGYNTIPNQIKTLHTYKKIHTAPDIEKKHKPCAKKHKAYILKYKALILK